MIVDCQDIFYKNPNEHRNVLKLLSTHTRTHTGVKYKETSADT